MSVIVKQTIDIDLTPGGVSAFLYVSQGDYGMRSLVFNLRQRYSIFSIPDSVSSIKMEGVTKKGHRFSVDCDYVIGSSVAIAPLTADMTDTVGLVICQLVLYDGQNERLGSANFFIAVEQSPSSIKVLYSTVYWSELSKSWAVGGTDLRFDEETNNSKYWCEQVKDSRDSIELNKTAIESLQSQINQFIDSPVEHVGEVVNARIGYDGTVYETLGDAIRAQITKIGYISQEETIYFVNNGTEVNNG